jgi:hypothetical protein
LWNWAQLKLHIYGQPGFSSRLFALIINVVIDLQEGDDPAPHVYHQQEALVIEKSI